MNQDLLFQIYKANQDLSCAVGILDEWTDGNFDIEWDYVMLILDTIINMNERPNDIWDTLVALNNIDKIISCPIISEKYGSRFMLSVDYISSIYPKHKLPELTYKSTPLVVNLHFLESLTVLSLDHIQIHKFADDFGDGSGWFKQRLVEFGMKNPEQVRLYDIEYWVNMCLVCKHSVDLFITTVFENQIFTPSNIICCNWKVVCRYPVLLETVLDRCSPIRTTDPTVGECEYDILNMVTGLNNAHLSRKHRSQMIEILYSVEHNLRLPLSDQNILLIYQCHPTIWGIIRQDTHVVNSGLLSPNQELRSAAIDMMMRRMARANSIFEIKSMLQDMARMDNHMELLPHFTPFIIDYYASKNNQTEFELFWDDTIRIIDQLRLTQQILPLVEYTDFWKELL